MYVFPIYPIAGNHVSAGAGYIFRKFIFEYFGNGISGQSCNFRYL